ncbi:MAG: hypothetical protein SFU53_12430 [Terrimicrobiaceae bacterium]|nr:hypothetical protein [Terrimicrobiaceae bacterium]
MKATIKLVTLTLFTLALPLTAASPDAVALRKSAQTALSSNNFVDAEKDYKQLTEISADDPDAWHGLANALDGQGRHKEADPVYLRAASIYKEQG